MNGRKNKMVVVAWVLSISLIAASLTAMFMANHTQYTQFQILGSFCQNIIEKRPEAETAVMAVLKEYPWNAYHDNQAVSAEDNILLAYGYQSSDFSKSTLQYRVLFATIGFVFGGMLFLLAFWYDHKKRVLRIEELTDYLERVNTGSPGLLSQEEDDFSKLQDELYKTVTMLYQTRDAALEAKHNFAENLSNIAHQLKTPITAISLSTQMAGAHSTEEYRLKIQGQLNRLTHLEEALLLLARLDTGTLSLELKPVDVFTVLSLAADNLQEVLASAGVSVDIPEMGELTIVGDLDWTMEAIMNLLKNCMEHTPVGGTVHCSYEQNSLYTRIRIWDEGNGFAKEDIPHLFERFYRGRDAKDGGIGIGLSLAKAILERENGMLNAMNIPKSGACFEIRMYSH